MEAGGGPNCVILRKVALEDTNSCQLIFGMSRLSTPGFFLAILAFSGISICSAVDHQKGAEWLGKWSNQKDPKKEDREMGHHWKTFQILREGDDYFFKSVSGSRLTKLEFNSSMTRATGSYMAMGITAPNKDRIFSELTFTLSNGILSVKVERDKGWISQFKGRFRHKFDKAP